MADHLINRNGFSSAKRARTPGTRWSTLNIKDKRFLDAFFRTAERAVSMSDKLSNNLFAEVKSSMQRQFEHRGDGRVMLLAARRKSRPYRIVGKHLAPKQGLSRPVMIPTYAIAR